MEKGNGKRAGILVALVLASVLAGCAELPDSAKYPLTPVAWARDWADEWLTSGCNLLYHSVKAYHEEMGRSGRFHPLKSFHCGQLMAIAHFIAGADILLCRLGLEPFPWGPDPYKDKDTRFEDHWGVNMKALWAKPRNRENPRVLGTQSKRKTQR